MQSDSGCWQLFVDWIAGCFLVFCTLFGFGKIILGEHSVGLLFLTVAALAATDSARGITGPIRFDASGNRKGSVRLATLGR